MPTQDVSSSTAMSAPEKNSFPPEYGFSTVKFAAIILVVFPTILTMNVSMPVMFISSGPAEVIGKSTLYGAS